MMGQKDFTAKLFHCLSLSKLVPEGHLVRRLEQVLDLGFVRQWCAPYYSHTGQPSVDPIVVFKMLWLARSSWTRHTVSLIKCTGSETLKLSS